MGGTTYTLRPSPNPLLYYFGLGGLLTRFLLRFISVHQYYVITKFQVDRSLTYLSSLCVVLWAIPTQCRTCNKRHMHNFQGMLHHAAGYSQRMWQWYQDCTVELGQVPEETASCDRILQVLSACQTTPDGPEDLSAMAWYNCWILRGLKRVNTNSATHKEVQQDCLSNWGCLPNPGGPGIQVGTGPAG